MSLHGFRRICPKRRSSEMSKGGSCLQLNTEEFSCDNKAVHHQQHL